jgi:hypothetical protein
MAGVVFALDRPAEGEAAAGKAGERALEVTVYSTTPGIEHGRGDRNARRDQALALGPAPGF